MTTSEDRFAALEAQLALERDYRQVQHLIASYGPLVDTADTIERARRLAELWVEDGIYDIGGVGAQQGREDIAHAFEQRHFGQVAEGVCHVMGLPLIEVAGDCATALNYSCVFRPDGDERFFPWRVSANRWEFVRTGEGWRIARRVNRLMTGDAAALAMLRGAAAMIGGAQG